MSGVRATGGGGSAALAAAEKDFAKQLEANRRAWEQASQGKYLGLDPFAGPGVDGPPPPERRKETGKENRDREEIDDESLFEGKELTPSQMRPAGMTSKHLERVARRDRNKYAQRQKDLGFGTRPDFSISNDASDETARCAFAGGERAKRTRRGCRVVVEDVH